MSQCDRCETLAPLFIYDGLDLCAQCEADYVGQEATDRARERVALCLVKADLEALLAKIESGNADAHGVYEALQAASLRLILAEAV